MLGSLARWLRLFGYDCAYSDSLDDPSLRRLAAAEERWLLTRDAELAQCEPRARLIAAVDLEEQLREVFAGWCLRPAPALERARCGACNGSLERLSREQVLGLVPTHIAATVADYRRCASCGRVYWHGSHAERIVERMQRICAGL
jgi:uncharacterized protein with PIN domain